MKNLHAITEPIPNEILRAAAALALGYTQMQFRLTGEPYDPTDINGIAVQYRVEPRSIWTNWWSTSVQAWAHGDGVLTPRVSPPQIEAVRARFVP